MFKMSSIVYNFSLMLKNCTQYKSKKYFSKSLNNNFIIDSYSEFARSRQKKIKPS